MNPAITQPSSTRGLDHAKRDEDALRVTEDLLAILPKIELHTHLAGNIPEWLFVDMARKYGIQLADPANPYEYVEGMEPFLALFKQVTDTFRTPEDLYRVSYESLVDEHRSSKLRYREVHYAPTINPHVDYADSIAAIAEGMEHAKRDHGVEGRIIIAIYRNQGAAVAEKLVAEMAANPHPAVVGIGIEADETVGPIQLFERTYAMARDAGYRLTAHVGEHADVNEVLCAVDQLKVDRLDHGYALAQDKVATARVVEAGLHLASTWVSARLHPRGLQNPLRTMLDAGLDASISSDDPGICKVTLNEQLLEAALELELPDSYLINQTYSQLTAAWIDDATRSEIRADIDEALTNLRPTHLEK
ncbi:adenosine deaminase [Paenarthrobacter sp. RAF54_2]|uniref:adenosine deaminase family protein n=1 Tax=Paenarthrobacter sp. RAF54_2 TaxID=3233061 RepID=UPI003F97484D